MENQEEVKEREAWRGTHGLRNLHRLGFQNKSPIYQDVPLLCGLFWAKGKLSCGLKRNFYTSLHYIEVELWALAMIRDDQRWPFLTYIQGRAGQSANHRTHVFPAMIIWSPKVRYPILSSECLIYPVSIFVWISYLCEVSNSVIYVGMVIFSCLLNY